MNLPQIVLDGVADNVVVARAFASSTMHVFEANDDDVEGIRLVVSELVTALVNHGATWIWIDVLGDRHPVMRVGCAGGLPDLSNTARSIVDASLDGELEVVDGSWTVPLPVLRA